jgi:hypothetical protein
VKQVPALRRKFLKYTNYQDVVLEDIVGGDLATLSIYKEAFIFASVYVENVGNGKFTIKNLPDDAQFFPIYALGVGDINSDGNQDILLAGNLDATQPDYGRYDAGFGLALVGDGQGSFSPLPPQQSGWVVEGQARDIQCLRTADQKTIYLVSRNNSVIKIFEKD